MGRTLPSGTMAFMQEQENFSKFRRALRRADQLALDDLFAAARCHVAAAAYAANALPMETMLLAMLLEEHKEVMHLRVLVERLEDNLASQPALPEKNPAMEMTNEIVKIPKYAQVEKSDKVQVLLDD